MSREMFSVASPSAASLLLPFIVAIAVIAVIVAAHQSAACSPAASADSRLSSVECGVRSASPFFFLLETAENIELNFPASAKCCKLQHRVCALRCRADSSHASSFPP